MNSVKESGPIVERMVRKNDNEIKMILVFITGMVLGLAMLAIIYLRMY